MLKETLNQANKFNAAVNELASVVSTPGVDFHCAQSDHIHNDRGAVLELAEANETIEKQRKLLVGYMKANANLSKRLADTEQEHIRVGYASELDRLLHAAGIEIRVTGSTQGRCVEFDMRSKVTIEEKVAMGQVKIGYYDPTDAYHNIETGRVIEIKTESVRDMGTEEDVSLVMRVHQ